MKRRGDLKIEKRQEIVFIDESKFGHKRKYNQGRQSNRASWVFLMLGVKEECRRPILRVVDQHLMPILQKHVRQGSTVVSDEWRDNNCLRDAGYEHLTVNHKEVFVDPHTQNIERFLGSLQGNSVEI
ncbi:hypothetical protein QQF64_031131 [Cirrhinus molitorella]|uniref:ISXO2-like transposase domain-containing protein n=1 Tax=Cirrhinus molitorella TaxID=172907 RepID=A0ABR3N5A3_9TELE